MDYDWWLNIYIYSKTSPIFDRFVFSLNKNMKAFFLSCYSTIYHNIKSTYYWFEFKFKFSK